MCFGYSKPDTNNCFVNFPTAYSEDPICCLLGQRAPTSADSATNTWDITIGNMTKTGLHLWARYGHTPEYHWLVIGS